MQWNPTMRQYSMRRAEATTFTK